MVARGIIAPLALLALAGTAFAQDAVIRIETAGRHRPNARLSVDDYGTTVAQWEALRTETELLYLDFDARSSNMLDMYLRNMTDLIHITISRANTDQHREGRGMECWDDFEHRMKILENKKRRVAVYVRHSHHKYIMGHKVVFNIHLNKTESILKKWNRYMIDCSTCWDTHTVRRFHHRAVAELNRVRSDISFTRRAYVDLVSHCFKELKKAKRDMVAEATQNVVDLNACLCKE